MRSCALYQVTCPHVRRPLPIAGILDGTEWAELPWLEAEMKVLGTLKQSPVRATFVKVGHDYDTLYLGYRCKSPDVVAVYDQKDSPLFREECVEFFLRIKGRADYWEFQGNSASVVYDAHVPRYAARRLWQRWCRWNAENLQFRSTVQAGQGWQATWSIPWSDLNVASSTEVLEIRFCRVADDQFLEAQEFSCWPPALKSFDEPSSWAELLLK